MNANKYSKRVVIVKFIFSFALLELQNEKFEQFLYSFLLLLLFPEIKARQNIVSK